MANPDCDVLVVGAGIAGALIAHEAAEAGLRVIILEAGIPFERRQPWIDAYFTNGWPFFSSSPLVPQQDFVGATWRDPEKNYWEQVGPYAFDSTYERRGGGTTLHWLGTAMRFVPNDFKVGSAYERKDIPDWPITYDDLEPWYTAAENKIGVAGVSENQYAFEGRRSQPYPMYAVPQSYLDGVVSKAIGGKSVKVANKDVALNVGATPQARNTMAFDRRPICMGNSSCVPICPIGAKYDATVHLGKACNPSAKGSVAAEIRYRAVVTALRVDQQSSKIKAVAFKQWSDNGNVSEETLTAHCYVLAANAVETVKILLNSKWRSEDRRDISVANFSDQVGRNLMDHICQVSWALMPDPVFPYRGPLSTSGIENFRDGELRKVRSAYRIEIGNDGWSWPKSTPQSTVKDILDTSELRGKALRDEVGRQATRHIRMAFEMESPPLENSRITLSESLDALGVPRPKIAYNLSPYALDGFVESMDVAAQIFQLLGIRSADVRTEVNEGSPGYFEYKGGKYEYRGAGHLMGTYRMGTDAKTSVVDVNQKSHDHSNLYLVGSGTFPTSGTANPTLTIAALALKSADRMIGELRNHR